MEEKFRSVNLKFKLDGGKWYVLEDFVVCEEGKEIKPEQAKMLRFLDYRIDEFKIKITSHNNKKGECEILDTRGFNDFDAKDKKKSKKDEDDDENEDDNEVDNEIEIN